jgi:uncharacterized protein
MKPDESAPAPEHQALAQLYLDAFVDGELAADERAHALARLETDAEFKAQTCELRTLKERVRNAYTEPPAQPVRARRPPRASVSRALAAGILLVAGIATGWMARDFAPAAPSFDRLAGLPDGYRAVALSQTIDQNKIILHLDSGDAGRLNTVLDLADRLLARQPAARIEIVVNSYGLDLLRADVTPLAARIEDMGRRHANLSFVACGQTVARLKRDGVKVELLPVAFTASSAINEIMTRMGQGWVYVKV